MDFVWKILFIMFLFLLADINECAQPNACGLNAVCTNYLGNYTCDCKEGYRGNPFTGVSRWLSLIVNDSAAWLDFSKSVFSMKTDAHKNPYNLTLPYAKKFFFPEFVFT